MPDFGRQRQVHGPDAGGDGSLPLSPAAGPRRARAKIDSSAELARTVEAAERRRHTEQERQRLQARSRAGHAPPRAEEPSPSRFSPLAPKPASSRFMPPAPSPPGQDTVRPVPKMPRRQTSAPVNSRPAVVLGAVLLAGLTILAFAGGRIFGSASAPPNPPSQDRQVAASGFPTPSGSPEAWSAGVPSIPTATTMDGGRAPTVCIDPGHGGSDSGFTQFWGDLGFTLVEKNLVLEHAWDLEARLKQHGYNVVMTRRTDVAVNPSGVDVNGDGKTGRDDSPDTNPHRNRNLDDFQARINVCNEANADLLVSMHVNGFSNSIPRGYETWYTAEREFGEQSRRFAILAYDALKRQLAAIGYAVPPEVERGANPDTAANVDTPNSTYRHFIITGPAAPGAIEPSAMPGAIVEALFVSNDLDAAVLATPGGRNAIVNAYEEAIVQYFEEYPPG